MAGAFWRPGQAEPPQADIEFIIDSSGSMAALTEGKSQMDIAKSSIKSTIATLPGDISVALRAYGHRVPKSDKEASCKDSELAIPFGPLNSASFGAKVDALSPNGYSPIAYSLKEAAKDFLGKESQHVIILLSDGEETCGGDPVAEAKNLLAQGFKVIIHTIGFRVDASTRAQLTAISSATGGLYFDAKDAASLTPALKEAAQKALLIAKPREEAGGQEVRGGNGYNDAVLLQPGEYRLDHYQRPDEYDYFYVSLKKSQSLIVSMATFGQGIWSISNGKIATDNNPWAGLGVIGPDFQNITSMNVTGPYHKQSREAVARQDGKYYILIGNRSYIQNKDSLFSLEIKERFDANIGADAGDDIAHATKIKLGEYAKNWLLYGNDEDVYQLEGRRGESYTIKIIPADLGISLRMAVYDQDRVKLASGYASNSGAAVRLENITLKTEGPFYIQVAVGSAYDQYPFEYALSIQKSGAVTDKAASAPTEPHSAPAGEAGTEKGEEKDVKTNFLSWLVVILLVLAAAAVVIWKFWGKRR